MNDKFDAQLLKKVWWICVMNHLFHMFKYFCIKGSKFKFGTNLLYLCIHKTIKGVQTYFCLNIQGFEGTRFFF